MLLSQKYFLEIQQVILVLAYACHMIAKSDDNNQTLNWIKAVLKGRYWKSLERSPDNIVAEIKKKTKNQNLTFLCFNTMLGEQQESDIC